MIRFPTLPSIISFGIPMGLLGTGLNAQHLIEMLAWQDSNAALILFSAAWLSLILVTLGYTFHLFISKRIDMWQEWGDPAQRSFFPSITLTILLFVLSLEPYLSGSLAGQKGLQTAYFITVFFHVLLNLKLISSWLFQQDIEIGHHQPSWFILLSGNFVVVIAGLKLVDLTSFPVWYEVIWMFFSVGLFLWLSFTVSLFYRLIFDKPLQHALRPSLFIFLAPPSLAVVASIMLGQSVLSTPSLSVITPLTWLLYSFATVMLCVLLTLVGYFYQSGLTLAAWAYVYPLAAYGLATQYMAENLDTSFLQGFSVFILMVVLSFIILLSHWMLRSYFENKAT